MGKIFLDEVPKCKIQTYPAIFRCSFEKVATKKNTQNQMHLMQFYRPSETIISLNEIICRDLWEKFA